MSRGPGKTQISIIKTLKAYQDLNVSLQWEFNPGASWMAIQADDYDIERHRRGEIVPVWIIIRDTGIDKTALSRAIKGLDRMGYITRRGADLGIIEPSHLCICENTKYVSLTEKGKECLKRQQRKAYKVDT